MTEITLTINGEELEVDVNPTKTLVRVLREDVGLKGTKQACSTGVCGACTVRIDGEARKSCMHMAGVVDGAEIQTVEGLAEDDELHAVQRGFVEEFGLQCGFCTPGFLMSTAALLEDNPDPTDEEIDHALHGNICRCTGYRSIRDSVRTAAEYLDGEAGADATEADGGVEADGD